MDRVVLATLGTGWESLSRIVCPKRKTFRRTGQERGAGNRWASCLKIEGVLSGEIQDFQTTSQPPHSLPPPRFIER